MHHQSRSSVETRRSRTGAASGDPYDIYAYRGVTIPYASPAHIAACGRWSGFSPKTECLRVAELGCGDGGNLLPLAFYHLDSTFVGIDSSRTAVDRAQADADRIGLRNVQYLCSDLRNLATLDLGQFDYVIAHGIYSWVPDGPRDAILRFCRDRLAPNGLAYISYNAQPGWSTRQLVRETLRRAQSVREANFTDKATKAIELAARLLDDLPPARFGSAVALAEELSRVRDSQPFYVFHEYLGETNDGFWLSDFVERAQQNDLVYVVDALFCRWEGHVREELRTAVAKRKLNQVEHEQTLDLLTHRFFRASILSRAADLRVSTPHHEVIKNSHVASSLRAQSDPLSLGEGTIARFAGTAGSDVMLDSSITKAAVILLGASWPVGLPFDVVYENSLSLLEARDYPVQPTVRRQLLDDIEALFEAGQIDLRLREPMYDTKVTNDPTAHALARWEADHRKSLTTPHHIPVAFDSATLELVRAMDGSRSRSDLQEMLGADFVDQTLPILGRCGLLADPHSAI